MYTFLIILLILDSFVLVTAILLQAGKGSGLAASFGGASSSPEAFIGIRQAGNLLTKVTWFASGVFLVLSFVLQLMSTHSRAPKSVLDGQLGAPAPAATPGASDAAPVVPLTPAQPTTPDTNK